MPIVTGIVLHEPDGAVVADAANGYITYVDPTTGPDNGKIFIGAAVPTVVKDAKTVLFSEKEKKERNNADGHVLAVSDYEPGSEYVYYWGLHGTGQISRLPLPGISIWQTLLRKYAIR